MRCSYSPRPEGSADEINGKEKTRVFGAHGKGTRRRRAQPRPQKKEAHGPADEEEQREETRRNTGPLAPGRAYPLQTGAITVRKSAGEWKVYIGSSPVEGFDRKTTADLYRLKLLAVRKSARRNPKARRNGDLMDEAERMYEDFHGRPPNRTITHTDDHEYRSELAELGALLELRFKVPGGVVHLENFGPAQVTCTPDGHTIYLLGGNQKIDTAALDIESDKDYIELGEATYIEYFTKKGFHNFEPIRYHHKFGEEDGIRPVLAYDRINEKLFLLGGNYEVKPEGIVN